MQFTFLLPPYLSNNQITNYTPQACKQERHIAKKLSLPTFRERRYLEDHNICRAKGRALYFERRTTFSLMIWDLIQEDEPHLDDQVDIGDEEEQQSTLEDNKSISQDARKLHRMKRLNNRRQRTLLENQFQETVQNPIPSDQYVPGYHTIVEIPPWAYIVRIRVSKAALGKRAVQRNRAKRRIRAAANQIFPQYAERKLEYVFSVNPESLVVPYSHIVEEITDALKQSGCWVEYMPLEMLRRPKILYMTLYKKK